MSENATVFDLVATKSRGEKMTRKQICKMERTLEELGLDFDTRIFLVGLALAEIGL